MADVSLFFIVAGGVALCMLIWDAIEVGRNDAANIVNAVFGARVMQRRRAVYLAGVFVIIGAWAGSQVIETARKGIFDPELLSLTDALTVFIAVYITDTVLLYSFSAFGMPVSTTACLVFELMGAAFALGGAGIVHWDKCQMVIVAIICSIIISGMAGFVIQRLLRGVIGKNCEDPQRIRLYGPVVAGFLLTGLCYFLLMKGMKHIGFVQIIKGFATNTLGIPLFLLLLWFILTVVIWLMLDYGGERWQRKTFAALAIIGMIAIAFAFGQNDLANCASPGVASYMIIRHGQVHAAVDVPSWLLLGCGVLLFIGMMTKQAQRVTRAEVNTGSQGEHVRLYAPRWCLWCARRFVAQAPTEEALAPLPRIEEHQKIPHYDALRAAVITSVAASVIAFASGLGLPVSTTYVAFAAVVATGWADKVYQRGDADKKIGRTIWVVTCWFGSAFIAAIAAGCVALIIKSLAITGIVIALAANLVVRWWMSNKADIIERRTKTQSPT